MAYKYNPFTGRLDYYEIGGGTVSGQLEYDDDGTNINVFSQGQIVFKYNNATKQISLSSGVDTDGDF